MKKILAILLALLLVALMFGCTQTEEDTNTDEEIDPVTDEEVDPTVATDIDSTIIDEDAELDVGEMI